MSLADYKKAKKGLDGHQIESKEIFGKTLTLSEMFLKNTKNGETCVVRFKEDPEGFYFGGKTTIDMYNDFKACNVDITTEEVKVIYSEKESQNGRKYIAVEVL